MDSTKITVRYAFVCISCLVNSGEIMSVNVHIHSNLNDISPFIKQSATSTSTTNKYCTVPAPPLLGRVPPKGLMIYTV